jgi:hypothetical protein
VLGHFFLGELKCTLQLLLTVQMGVVQHDCILGLSEGAITSGGVNSVAFQQIGLHFLFGHFKSFGLEFVLSSSHALSDFSGKEDFEFCVGENDSSNVPAIHDYTACLTHGLLLANQVASYGWDGGHRTYGSGDTHIPYLIFDVCSVEVGAILTLYIPEGNLYGLQGIFDSLRVIQADLVLQKVEGYSAVHSSGVHIAKTEGVSQISGERTFSAGRKSINGDYNLFHQELLCLLAD